MLRKLRSPDQIEWNLIKLNRTRYDLLCQSVRIDKIYKVPVCTDLLIDRSSSESSNFSRIRPPAHRHRHP